MSNQQTLSFTVTVTVTHEEGRFISADALAAELKTSLESAQDDHWRGLDVDDSSYKVTSWTVDYRK